MRRASIFVIVTYACVILCVQTDTHAPTMANDRPAKIHFYYFSNFSRRNREFGTTEIHFVAQRTGRKKIDGNLFYFGLLLHGRKCIQPKAINNMRNKDKNRKMYIEKLVYNIYAMASFIIIRVQYELWASILIVCGHRAVNSNGIVHSRKGIQFNRIFFSSQNFVRTLCMFIFSKLQFSSLERLQCLGILHNTQRYTRCHNCRVDCYFIIFFGVIVNCKTGKTIKFQIN